MPALNSAFMTSCLYRRLGQLDTDAAALHRLDVAGNFDELAVPDQSAVHSIVAGCGVVVNPRVSSCHFPGYVAIKDARFASRAIGSLNVAQRQTKLLITLQRNGAAWPGHLAFA
ncbi:hypothetical protein AOQ71_02505 [Bradyrhizobium manausense]|uniref:Uncharacterized protein n=1 Tax=Bradyrhizobium manausense TaxID=989370 RepID=A0A0R3E0A2_9BRAD|nr:hypothetical protein AOQ71_19010 [Bradyrhizobium manausense]KRQ15633.1 hypothetical protein AOQ71_08820 [Bradyrhizobium manausense]KRQ17370.1 hypothetical protein AOQ71_02505 [Bradyrhizobium manausense]